MIAFALVSRRYKYRSHLSENGITLCHVLNMVSKVVIAAIAATTTVVHGHCRSSPPPSPKHTS